DEDRIELDGQPVAGRERARVVELLERVRERAGLELSCRVMSRNDFPTAAGLASSASGFAALALASSHAAGLSSSDEQLSALARRSSASAARSLFGGFAELAANAEHASPLAPAEHWDVRLLVAVTETGRKPMGSTAAMQHTRATSPYYRAWVEHAPALYAEARQAVLERRLRALGPAMEQSTLMMHASMWAARPAILYLTEASLAVVRRVRELRDSGLECYFTIDAGPHVKVLVETPQARKISEQLAGIAGVQRVIECAPGPGAHLVPEPAATESR